MGNRVTQFVTAPPHERVHLVAAAALLHDAGKVLQPADVPLSRPNSNLRQMICPTDPKSGQSTHQHVLYTAQALEEAQSNYGKLDRSELFRVACYHHRPSTDSLDQNILTKADWLASGHDRRPSEEYSETITALMPILMQVSWPTKRSVVESFDLPAKLLSLSEDSFLPERQQDRAAYKQRCGELARHLIEGLRTQFRNPTECVEGLLGLTERVFHAVPASRDRKQQPDVTLFDHSRIVAAFAACLASQYSGQVRTPHELSGQFVLVGISLGSIQRFIFRVIPPIDERERAGQSDNATGGLTGARGLARRLRARSLYVSLLSWLAARRVLDELGLPATNLISNAGGRAILLLPGTDADRERINQSLRRIDEWFQQQVGGVLRLDIAQSDRLADEDFKADKFPQTFRDLDHRLSCARSRCAWPDAQDATGWTESGWVRDELSLPIDRDEFNIAMKELGARLPDANYLCLESGEPGLCPEFDVFGYRVSFHAKRPTTGLSFALRVNPSELAVPLSVTARYVPRATEDNLQRLRRCASDDNAIIDGAKRVDDLLSFEQIAQLSVDDAGQPIGQPMLGALKADVDRLGLILSYGLGEKVSFGRFGSLARTLDLFFKGFLTEKLQAEFPHVYTIFAGGDDLFLVGPWYDLVRLVGRLRKWFARLVTNNPNLTFSAGLVFAGSSTPVNHLAQATETALEHAKDGGRDRITIGSVTLTWERFQAAWDLHQLLLSESRPDGTGGGLNPSLLYRLLQYGQMGQRARQTDAQQTASRLDLKWRAQLSYDLKRNLPRPSANRPGLTEIQRQLLKIETLDDTAILQVAASLTLYVLRGNQR